MNDLQKHMQVRIIDLEDGISQAQHTIEFMHNCLTDLEHYKYSDTKQTVQTIKYLRSLFIPLKGCGHSMNVVDCKACRARRERQEYRSSLL
ncbi:MAG: hypothetical protein AABY07_00200 [Nanoarchaeota archaeon]